MSQVSLLNIGSTALTSYRDALGTVGNNISNANTEGYTRQRVDLASNTSTRLGNGSFQGQGVHTEAIVRVTNQYLVGQLQRDTALSGGLSALNEQMAGLDGLLADPETGLAPVMDNFFVALQGVADDPTSVPMRQLVLSEATGLANRFGLLHERLAETSAGITRQLTDSSNQVNTLANGIATLNKQVNAAMSVTGQAPNDLLDQRDLLLQELSGLVAVSTSTSGNQLNVFIGNGQSLVLGAQANTLAVDSSPLGGLSLTQGGARLQVTSDITGGTIGGLLEFRRQGLDPALNSLGQLAMVISDAVNGLQAQGVNLNGSIGEPVFAGITGADPVGDRVLAVPGNAMPDDRQLSLAVDSAADLTLSDYQLEFNGPSDRDFVLRRLDDNSVVVKRQLSGALPETISVDGFSLRLDAGSFQQGDAFVLRPARNGARDFAVTLRDPQGLALAAPLTSSTTIGNTGSGQITDLSVLDASQPAFADFAQGGDGTLAPPLLIRFNSPTSYDVLDNSVPGRPQSLVPPLENLGFVPGVDNNLLPAEPGSTLVVADGSANGVLSGFPSTRATPGPIANNYPNATVLVDRVDPDTFASLGSVSVPVAAGSSASTIRDQLSAVPGVTASASTTLGLRNLVDDGSGNLRLYLNGVDLTDAADGPVGNPLTLNELTGRINTLPALAGLGVEARISNGDLVLTARDGRDLTLDIGGDGTDRVTVVGQAGSQQTITGVGAGNVQGVVVGGVVTAHLEPGVSLAGDAGGGLFSTNPPALSGFLGYQISLAGQPQEGDTFAISGNGDGVGDNRNGLRLAGLQTAGLLGDGAASLNDGYAQLVETVGATASRARLEAASGESLLQRAQSALDSVAGVNLDEEAANLLRFEQAYGAATRVISVARDIFDTLLAAVR